MKSKHITVFCVVTLLFDYLLSISKCQPGAESLIPLAAVAILFLVMGLTAFVKSGPEPFLSEDKREEESAMLHYEEGGDSHGKKSRSAQTNHPH